MPQITAADVVLAQLSLDAESTATGALPALPAGFTPAPLTITPASGASYANGLYTNGPGAALADIGMLNGVPTLVVSFRGSVNETDSIHDLQGTNAAYPEFSALVAAVDAYAASGAVQQVMVTGHSLGGSMAQLYMASHPDLPGGVTHEAVTFGSTGALLTPALDPRIDNIVISDDPTVPLAAHRAEIGALLHTNPALAQAAAQVAAAELPGLTVQDALASLPSLTADYVNRGDITLLPGANGALGPAGLSGISFQEHAATLYLAETEAAAAGTLPTLDVPQQPVTVQQAFDRAVYDGDAHSLTAEFLVQQAFDIWTQGHAWPGEAHNWLASLHHHDLHLL